MSLLANLFIALSASPALALLVKATVALALTLLALWVARHRSAALRHRLVGAGFLVLLLLPLAAAWAPPRWVTVNASRPVPARNSASVAPLPRQPRLGKGFAATVARPASSLAVPIGALLFFVWAAGLVIASLPVTAGLWELRRLRHAAQPWREGQRRLLELACEDDIDWNVPILLHEEVGGPMTCGAANAAVVLPLEARNWPIEEVDRVLLHELEHVRRRDWIGHLSARLVCSIYWFHPLVWVAWRRMTLEAERACDDAVLRRSDAVAYADQLVTLAQRLSHRGRPPLLAMANRTALAKRVGSLLDRGRPRGRAGLASALLAGVAAFALVAVLSPLRLIAALPPGLQGIVHYPTPGQPAGTPRMEFDVVSVKPAAADERGGIVRNTPGYQGYICQNVDLETIMTVAYGVTPRQIAGGPSWISSDRWDIEAKSDRPYSVDELHLMLEHALEDRFQIKLHHETRQETVLALTTDDNGAKLKVHDPPNDTNSPPIGITGSGNGALEVKGTNVEMTYLAFFIARLQPVPVLDHTGLTGHYDIDVSFQLPPPPTGADGSPRPGPPDFSPLFDAMREQLGLRLVKGGKGPVDYLVIDAVQKPTSN